MLRALLTGLTTLLVVSCAGPAVSPGGQPTRVLSPEERARIEAELAPFQPAFDSLDAALDARDDRLARRILDRILVRDPQGAALERARGFERVVEGREWTQGLDFRLEATREGETDAWRISIAGTCPGDEELVLSGAPPALRVALQGVGPDGIEQRFATTMPAQELARWRLAPGALNVQDLGSFTIPIGTALAVRAVFEVEFLPGDVTKGGAVRPASRLPIARTEVLRLAPFLSTDPVDPAELARYVREEMIRTPPLLERAVRIAPAERARALDLLTPAVLELPSGEVEKVTVALRWLSGQGELGSDARSWRQWLDRRAKARASAARDATSAQSTLELPTQRP